MNTLVNRQREFIILDMCPSPMLYVVINIKKTRMQSYLVCMTRFWNTIYQILSKSKDWKAK